MFPWFNSFIFLAGLGLGLGLHFFLAGEEKGIVFVKHGKQSFRYIIPVSHTLVRPC